MASITIDMDELIKTQFDEICKELGLSISSAVTLFAQKMIQEKCLPFDITLDPFYSASNMKALTKSIEQMREGHIVKMTLEDLDKMTNE